MERLEASWKILWWPTVRQSFSCLRSCVGRSASHHDGLGLPGLLIKYGPVVACSRAREAHCVFFLCTPPITLCICYSSTRSQYVGRLSIPVCGSVCM